MLRTGALIVGGGPAGSAAAIALARSGERPLLIERDRAPGDALCGGFLSWATIARLRGLGVAVEALGAHPIERLALFAGARTAEAALPARAAGLSRRTLDAALLAQASAAGAGIERGVTARGWADGRIRIGDGTAISADAVLLATGKHDLRGLARPKGDTIGLRFRLAPTPCLARLLDRRIELHLFDGGYAGLLIQEDGFANLCLAARAACLADAGGRPERLLADIAGQCPALADRLDAAAAIGRAQAIANIPYGWRAGETAPQVYRLGDQAGVIPSLAGEGIDIALASGIAAVGALLSGEAAGVYQAAFAARLHRPIGLAGALWRGAEHRGGSRAMIAAVRLAPGLAGLAARLTRIAA